MNRLLTLAAIAAALVIAVGGGALLLGIPDDNRSVGVPVPSPSASPSESVPAALRYQWLGETRDVAGLEGLAEHNSARRMGTRVDFRIVRLPTGQDPADVVQSSGADAMRRLLDEAVAVPH